MQVREDIKQACTPQPLQPSERLSALLSWEEIVEQLTGPSVPKCTPLSRERWLPPALHIIWQRYCGQAEAYAASGSRPFAADADAVHDVRDKDTVHFCGRHQDRACRALPEGVAEKGVFKKPLKRARRVARQEWRDADFFMGLQRGESEASASSNDSLADG